MVLVARVNPAAARGIGARAAGPLAEPGDDDAVMELKPLGGLRPSLRRHSLFNHVPSRPTVAPLSPRKSLATFASPWIDEVDEDPEDGERLSGRRPSRQNSLRPDVGQVSGETAMEIARYVRPRVTIRRPPFRGLFSRKLFFNCPNHRRRYYITTRPPPPLSRPINPRVVLLSFFSFLLTSVPKKVLKLLHYYRITWPHPHGGEL